MAEILPNVKSELDAVLQTRLPDGDRRTQCMVLVARLKVALLADVDHNGGLSAASRRSAWDMVRDLGDHLLAMEPKPNPKD